MSKLSLMLCVEITVMMLNGSVTSKQIQCMLKYQMLVVDVQLQVMLTYQCPIIL